MRAAAEHSLLRRTAEDLIKTAPYALGFAAGLAFGVAQMAAIGAAAIWVTNGVLALGLLQLERRRQWVLTGLCLVVATVPLLIPMPAASQGMQPLAYVNLVEAWLIAVLARRVCGRNLDFSDGRRLFAFLAGAVLPACAISVALAEACLFLSGAPERDTAFNWLMSHLLGAAILVPAGTVFSSRRRFRGVTRSAAETAASLALFLAATVALLYWQGKAADLFLLFPMMMLLAFRHGPVGAAMACALLGLVMSAFTYAGLERMALGATGDPVRKIQWLQFFLATTFLTTLPAAGAVASYVRLRTLLARRTATARAARRRADLAVTAKGEFLANMSHEIRTPLNGVIGLADALSRTELAPEQRNMLDMILSSGKALTGLLSDALDLARADSGALTLAAEPFDVRETVGAAVFLFETVARDKGLAFEVRFDLDAPALLGDPLRLRQIVSNLINNAVKFTAEGEVYALVSVRRLDGSRARLQITVRDTGPGFGPEVKARLFNRFEQGDSSVTRRHGGSGLGLSIAHRLAVMMDGDIVCESIPGAGSIFTLSVDLPLAAALQGSAAPAPEPEPLQRRMKVLLAEDHPVNRKVIQAMLGDSVDLTIVEDGQAAVEQARQDAFDAILMDTHMPVMDGLTAIRIIRADEAYAGRPRTPIVSLTADAMPQHLDAAFAAGADLHLAKPITGEGLAATLKACLCRAEARPLAKAG
jgi:signal transduction histidine kinase/ActR/RegA family two-component response regulator